MNFTSSSGDRLVLRDAWLKQLRIALQADGWGQLVEAVEGYEKIRDFLCNSVNQLDVNKVEFEFLENFAMALHSRIQCLSNSGEDFPHPTKEDLQKIRPVLKHIFTLQSEDESTFDFPFETTDYVPLWKSFLGEGNAFGTEKSFTIETNEDEEDSNEERKSDDEETIVENATKSGEKMKSQKSYVSIGIEKIGLKDSRRYVHPRIRVSVYDRLGFKLETVQETVDAISTDNKHCTFNQTIHLQTPLEELLQANAAIFLEFIHYKKYKGRDSTRCWSLLEPDDFQPGNKVMQVYAKPICVNRDNFFLHSVKPLYMHLQFMVHKDKGEKPTATFKSATVSETQIERFNVDGLT